MFLPDRFIKGECPKCGAKDQYGDTCEVCGAVYAPTELKNPYSTLSGATPVLQVVRALLLPAVRSRAASPSCEQWTQATGRLQPEVANKVAGVARTATAARPGRLGHLAATRPTSASRSPTRRASTSTSGSTRRSATWPSLKNRFDGGCATQRGRATSTPSWPTRRTEQVHFIGKDIIYFHTLFWPAMLQFSGRKVPDARLRARLHDRQRREDEQESRGTGISPLRYLELGMNPEWLRYYIAAKLNAQRRGHRLQPRRLHGPASTPTWSASTSTSPAARPGFIAKRFDGAAGPTCRRDGRALLDGLRDAARTPWPSAVRSPRHSARRCARSWPLADRVNAYVDASTSPGNWPSRPARTPALHDVCSGLHRGLPAC
jgi:methionyl-tRNA synthetase